MPTLTDWLQILLIIATAVALVIVMTVRRRQHREFMDDYASREVCEHLRPALDQLRARGHVVVRCGQLRPDTPLEIHITPTFDPEALVNELDLAEPVAVSERNVLYCEEDWCELHPLKP